MEATQANFLEFISRNVQFRIPIYQRPYSWTIKQCEQLWNDVINSALNTTVLGHFLGSIVYIHDGLYQASKISKLVVIDGQQRLTTLSLLIKAIAEKMKESSIDGEEKSSDLVDYYLINSRERGNNNELRPKIVLTKGDNEVLSNLIGDREITSPNSYSKIMQNYKFFKEQITKSQIDVNKIFEGINKLLIVDIALDREKDNPQLIFESLNSTGLELSQADLIRNFVLMRLEPHEQEMIYDNYWYPMEKEFEQKDYETYFNRFMRDYLTIELGRIPNIRDVYSEFKTYVSDKMDNILDIVKKIKQNSAIFSNLVYARDEDKEINQTIKDINELKVEVSYPFLMQIFNDYREDVISKDELLKIMKMVESYVYRRAVCGIPTHALNKIFATLVKEIDKERYVESIIISLLLKESYKRFPNDEEFRSQFPIVQLYNLRIVDYTLRKLENHIQSKEPISVENYTIEHIMPQKIDSHDLQWIKDLGTDWQQQHQKYLHTIGNLTLTGYNSELSNSTFQKKSDMEGGFKHSRLWLNSTLSNLDTWNSEKIVERAMKLTDQAIKIWTYPSVDETLLQKYKKKNKASDNDISEEDHFENGSEITKTIYESLRSIIFSIGTNVLIEPKKRSIAFVHNTIFMYVKFTRYYLKLVFDIKEETSKDLVDLIKDSSFKGRWVKGDLIVEISSTRNLERIVPLIRKAYDEN